MARGEGRGKLCSYKKTTIIICSVNIVAALYILHSLYNSLYIYNDDPNVGKFTEDQMKRMKDSIRIRKMSEPRELIRMVKQIKEDLARGNSVQELSQHVKQIVTREILQKLKGLHTKTNISEHREALESWRQEKLQEVRQLTIQQTTLNSTIPADLNSTIPADLNSTIPADFNSTIPADFNSTIPAEEAEKFLRILESDWTMLLEEIGYWMPSEIINKEHHDKSEGDLELEEHIIPGRPIPPECHAEIHTDYDGTAVRWGLTHPKNSAADCCQACLDQAKNAKPGALKCNIWVYCPSETGCYSPDIYEHKHQECWLKYAEKPQLNFKEKYPESYRDSHPTAPVIVPWISGVTSS